MTLQLIGLGADLGAEQRPESEVRSESRGAAEQGPVLAMRWRWAIAAYVGVRLSEDWSPGWAEIATLSTSQLAEVIDGARDEREAFALVGYSAALVDAQHDYRRRLHRVG